MHINETARTHDSVRIDLDRRDFYLARARTLRAAALRGMAAGIAARLHRLLNDHDRTPPQATPNAA